MGIKDLKWQIFQRNQLLFLLSFGLLLSLIVTAEESTTNHTARIAEIKSNLLKMIQKGKQEIYSHSLHSIYMGAFI